MSSSLCHDTLGRAPGGGIYYYILYYLLSLYYYFYHIIRSVPKKTQFQNCYELASDDQRQCGGRELIRGSQFMAILKVRFLGHPVYYCRVFWLHLTPIFDLQNQVAQASILLFRPISPKMGALCRYAAGLWSGDIPSTFAELAIQVEKKTIFCGTKIQFWS